MLKSNLNDILKHADTLKKDSFEYKKLQENIKSAEELFKIYKDGLKTGNSTKHKRGVIVNKIRLLFLPFFKNREPVVEELLDSDFDTSDFSETEEKIYPKNVDKFKKFKMK